MKHPSVAFLLSLLTIFGGHCYNGRWARATLFAALLLAAIVVSSMACFLGLVGFALDQRDFFTNIFGDVTRLKIYLTVVMAA